MFTDFIKLYDKNTMLCVTQLPVYGNPVIRYKKAADIADTDYMGAENVFFTPNALGYRFDKTLNKSTIKRNREHLHTLECLYADIDIDPADFAELSPEEIVNAMRLHNFGSEVPEPTMIVCSGNGLHLYWKINSLSYRGNIEAWEAMQQYIHDVFSSYGADSQVTNDKVRILRMPGTVNVKDKGTKECYVINFTGEVFDLHELIDEYEVKVKTNIICFNKASGTVKEKHECHVRNNGHVISFYAQLYRKRIDDLVTVLTEYRDIESDRRGRKGASRTGKRECILFLIRYYLLELGYSKEDALNEILEINNGLKNPLSKKEVICATKSAEMYHNGDKLNWKNHEIIKFLGITKDEMKSLKTIMSASEKADRAKKRDRERYLRQLSAQGKELKADAIKMRRFSIYELAEDGMDAKEICKTLNISKSTCYRELEAIKDAAFMEEYAAYKAEQEAERIAAENVEIATGTDGQIAFSYAFPKNSVPIISVCVYDSGCGVLHRDSSESSCELGFYSDD